MPERDFPLKIVYKCADVLITHFLLQIRMSQVAAISAWRWSVGHKEHNSFLGTPQWLSGSLGFGKGGSKRWDEHIRNIPAVSCNIWRFLYWSLMAVAEVVCDSP